VTTERYGARSIPPVAKEDEFFLLKFKQSLTRFLQISADKLR